VPSIIADVIVAVPSTTHQISSPSCTLSIGLAVGASTHSCRRPGGCLLAVNFEWFFVPWSERRGRPFRKPNKLQADKILSITIPAGEVKAYHTCLRYFRRATRNHPLDDWFTA